MERYTERVLNLVAQGDYRPLTLKAMSRRLAVPAGDYPEFRATVKGLIRDGRLVLDKAKAIRGAAAAATEADAGAILGVFRRTSRGFGFVRPLRPKVEGRAGDIYIPADDSLDASSGDEVAVRITKRPHTPGFNVQGRIIRVVARASGLFVGTYFEEDGAGCVRIDGTTFHEPLDVGDPGAKGARPGDKVTVEIVRYPTPEFAGEGVITEILGPRGQPGVDTLSVIRAFNIPDEFDDETLLEAREQARNFNEEDIGDRLDLRGELTVTIDPAAARDFDDAISLSRDERGFWTLGVHIADVGHFVPASSALDRSARTRGTSVYLPDRVIPMLPEVISNALASLQEGKTRYTLSVLMEFDAEGRRTDARFARSAIRVDRRFAYEQAHAVMMAPEGEPAPGVEVTPEVRDLLRRMLELAMILRRRRFRRGALELVMPEVEVELGDRGEVVGAHLAADDESHQVIEEFMLAANEAVAEHLSGRHVGFLRRVHADPEDSKLRQFAEFARSLGFEIEDPRSRFAIQRVLRESDDAPERYAVHYGLLRSLKQAVYTPEPEGHYALASENYCHFTSPIRRYPDLQVHRQLATLLARKKPRSDPDELVVLGEHCTRTERRAEAAERELIKVKLLTYLESRIGTEYHAVIIGVEDFGLFCQLVELPVEGLVHVTSLTDDYYYLEADTHTLVGRRSGARYRLGDRVEVRIARVDVDRRQLDLLLIGADDPERHLPPSRSRPRSRPTADADRAAEPPGRGERRAGPSRAAGTSRDRGAKPRDGGAKPRRKAGPKKSGPGKKGKRRR